MQAIDQLDIREALTDPEGQILSELAHKVANKDAVFVEVGSWKGFSTTFLATVAKECGGRLICVDHWKGNEGTWNIPVAQTQDIYKIFEHNMRSLGLWEIITPMITDSLTACATFADQSIDLIFIDADHRYAQFKADLQAWWPKVKVGGIICGHDCEQYYSRYPSVTQTLIDSSLKDDWITEIPCHPGITKALNEFWTDNFTIAKGGTIWHKTKSMTQDNEPTPIDIILPAHGRLDLTMKCVNALYVNTRTPFHLIVLDDSDASIAQGSFHRVDPADTTSAYFNKLIKYYPNITYINAPKPYLSGNEIFNEGFRHCKYDYVATIMNSLTVKPNWAVPGIRLMKDDPKIGVIGFKNLLPNGTIEHAGIEFHGFTPTDYGVGHPGDELTEIREVAAVQWAFALLRRKAVEGILSENVFHGFVGWDDIDDSFMVRSKGWKIVYCGYGVGTHQPRATRGDDSIPAYLKNQENAEVFYKRWGFWDKFLESKKMDVAYRLNPKIKESLTMEVTEAQVLQHLLEQCNQKLQVLCSQACKDLGVDPQMYILDVNPMTNLWQIRAKPGFPEPEIPMGIGITPEGDGQGKTAENIKEVSKV